MWRNLIESDQRSHEPTIDEYDGREIGYDQWEVTLPQAGQQHVYIQEDSQALQRLSMIREHRGVEVRREDQC